MVRLFQHYYTACLLLKSKRSNIQHMHLMEPASIKWIVPSRGVVVEVGKRQGLTIKKKTTLHKKAYAMADKLLLCFKMGSIYQIVTMFQDGMLVGGSGTVGLSVAERY